MADETPVITVRATPHTMAKSNTYINEGGGTPWGEGTERNQTQEKKEMEKNIDPIELIGIHDITEFEKSDLIFQTNTAAAKYDTNAKKKNSA